MFLPKFWGIYYSEKWIVAFPKGSRDRTQGKWNHAFSNGSSVRVHWIHAFPKVSGDRAQGKEDSCLSPKVVRTEHREKWIHAFPTVSGAKIKISFLRDIVTKTYT